jgi:ubiquinone/menaquinone biosynthesis C-methylase UbiE
VWDEISKRYHFWSLSNRWFYFLTGLEIKRKVHDAEYILDIGSGPGIFAEELAILFPKSKIVCLDSSPKMCRLSKGIIGKASYLPFKKDTFDVVTFCFSLHELEIDPALEEANRVLRRNGVIYIVDLNRDAPQILKRASKLILEKIMGKEYAEHLEKTWQKFKSCEEIAENLKRKGFEVEYRKGLQEIRIIAKKL